MLESEVATGAALAEVVAGRRQVHLATYRWFAPETVESMLDEEPGASSTIPWERLGARESVSGFAPLTLCGLALAGADRGMDSRGRTPGLLTAEELAFLPLEDCELAVLSACETNIGRRRAGQGIQSLQTALPAAGAATRDWAPWVLPGALRS